MEQYRVHSRCECQATLSAALDEKHFVLSGTAQRAGQREVAPAHSIDAQAASGRFDIAWLCPYCGRNTLRTFYAGALTLLRPTGTQDLDPP